MIQNLEDIKQKGEEGVDLMRMGRGVSTTRLETKRVEKDSLAWQGESESKQGEEDVHGEEQLGLGYQISRKMKRCPHRADLA